MFSCICSATISICFKWLCSVHIDIPCYLLCDDGNCCGLVGCGVQYSSNQREGSNTIEKTSSRLGKRY